MNFSKSLLIISLFLIFCIGLGAVNATEDVGITVNDIDNAATFESSVNDVDEIDKVSDGREINKSSEISDEIENANGTYNILTNYQIDKTLRINNDNVIIEGNNHTIYGSSSLAFHIKGSNVTIKNLKFVDCKSGTGAIFWSGSNGSISGCSFLRCSATQGKGGAIYFNSGGSIVSNCSFERCSATNYGGAIYSSSGCNLIVSDCSFVRCSAKDGGAIYFSLRCNSIVSGCSFVRCSATNEGGAIRMQDSGSVNYCIFENNDARSGSAFHIGRGSSNVDYNYFAFENNIAKFSSKLTWPSPENWVVLKVYNSSGIFYATFVDKNGATLDSFMPDYNALLVMGTRNIINIHNNTFSCGYNPTVNYDIYSRNTDKLLSSLPAQKHVPSNVPGNNEDINKHISNKINMENTGNPLIALLIALISLPIIRRRK